MTVVVVKVLTSKTRVTNDSQGLEDTVVDRKEGHIEGPIIEVADDDARLATLLVRTVGDNGSGRFVDDAKNLQTTDCPW